MTDEQYSGLILSPNLLQEFDNLGLQRSVELTDGFIGNQKSWSTRQRLRNPNSLTLPATELVRIGGIDLCGIIKSNFAQKLHHSGTALVPVERKMSPENLLDLRAGFHHRIEPKRGILSHQRNVPATNCAQFRHRQCEQISPPERDHPLDPGMRRRQADESIR